MQKENWHIVIKRRTVKALPVRGSSENAGIPPTRGGVMIPKTLSYAPFRILVGTFFMPEQVGPMSPSTSWLDSAGTGTDPELF